MMDIDERIEDTLAHYGVKGMKWGQRKDRTPYVGKRVKRAGKTVTTAGITRKKRFRPSVTIDPFAGKEIANKEYGIGRTFKSARKDIKQDLKALNKAYKRKLLIQGTKPEVTYLKEYSEMIKKNINKHSFSKDAIKSIKPYTTRHALVDYDIPINTLGIEVVVEYNIAKEASAYKKQNRKVTHSDELDYTPIKLVIPIDENGLVSEESMDELIDNFEESIAQAESFTEDDLAHFGIKGMKWGVRRIRKDIRKITKAKVREARLNAKRTKPTHTEQQKKNEEAFLTDDELRKRVNRMQMEKTYKQLTTPEKSKGRKLFEKIVVSQTEAIAKEVYKTAVKAIVENKIAAIKRDDKKKK